MRSFRKICNQSKNKLDWTTEERVHKFEDNHRNYPIWTTEISLGNKHTENQTEPRSLQAVTSDLIFMSSESQKVRRKGRTEKACTEIMAANFPHMAEDPSLQNQEAEWIPYGLNPKKSMPRYNITTNFWKLKKILKANKSGMTCYLMGGKHMSGFLVRNHRGQKGEAHFSGLKEKCQLKILYSTKTTSRVKGENQDILRQRITNVICHQQT